MNTRMNPLAVLICGVLLAAPVLAAEEGSKQDLGLSDYRYFKVYPHIERAQKAMKANDETRAISSFEHAHEMAPESTRLILWLAEAYRHFGHDQKAQALLESALKDKPQNPELQRALEVIPVPAPEIKTVEQLRALQQHCDAAPTLRCRSEVGNFALKLEQLEIARAQLSDVKFRRSKEGHLLTQDYTQRAIFLQQWTVADQGFALLDSEATLSEAQYQQWFAILLHMQRDQRILDLQSQGVMNSSGMQLAYAQSLAERNVVTPLRRYLASRKPVFETPAEERNWLRLLATYSQNPGAAVAGWAVKYQENKQYVLSTLVPIRIQKGDWQGVNELLNTFPETQTLESRLALSLARKDTQSMVELIKKISQTRVLSPRELEIVSYQLITQGQEKMATELLLSYWPFNQMGQFQHSLSTRLYTQLNEHPEWLTGKNKTRMAKPLPNATQRMAQARLFQGAENCGIVRNLLGDLSPQYDAESWSHLAQCYPQQPGLALYAAQQALARDPSPYYQRQVAYLAYAAEDYPLALASGIANLKVESAPELDDAARGFALLAKGKYREARDLLEKGRAAYPDSPEITRQLVYLNERLDDKPKTRKYSEQVVDDIDNTLTPQQKLSDKQLEDRFEFRRIHEDSARRWTFSFDSSMGLTKESMNSPSADSSGSRDKGNRSYGQMEAEYRIGRNEIIDGDLLSVYSRVFAGSGGHSNIAPIYQPMLGLGVRWKPLREQTIFFAAEQQLPLDRQKADADLMLRASASFLNDGKYSDDWHPTGKGWMAQNLYLDAAHYVKADYQIYTADYRMSWHHKISDHQTIEPYAHAQFNSSTNYPVYSDGEKYRIYRDNTLEGIGVRFNHWYGESHYDAYPHKVSVGLEYQHVSGGHHHETTGKNSLFLTIGARW